MKPMKYYKSGHEVLVGVMNLCKEGPKNYLEMGLSYQLQPP